MRSAPLPFFFSQSPAVRISTALLVLAARWRAARKRGPKLLAVTIDHALRKESAAEARAVKRLAGELGVHHRMLRWNGRKPKTGLQAAARAARYRLLADAARAAKATHVLTAHTLDDQAETVLIRMMHGSGLNGLAAMARTSFLPSPERGGSEPRRGSGERSASIETSIARIKLVRPLLAIPKARLIATLRREGIAFADDPSNRDPRFTRARLRGLMPALAEEGLDARRLALLAGRIRRANAAIELAVDVAAQAVTDGIAANHRAIVFDAEKFSALPAEVALRLLGRAIARVGDEGPVELGKLEALFGVVADFGESARNANRLRRTLAGALVTLEQGRLTIECAPPRSAQRGHTTLTTRKYGNRARAKSR